MTDYFYPREMGEENYAKAIRNHPDWALMYQICLCQRHNWLAGVVICEREIARRGLNTKTTEERFKL
jgi:hypothetical protein